MEEFKFQIGDIVRHIASGKFGGRYAVIMGRGIIHKANGTSKMYLLSTELFTGGFTNEDELALLSEQEKKNL